MAFFLGCGGCDTIKPQSSKIFKIGIIQPSPRFAPYIKKFKQMMGDLGYIEGQNAIFIYNGPTAPDQVANRLKYLKNQDIDLLYTLTTPVSRKACKIFEGTGIPMVFGPVFSPLEAGLTSSLTKPDKNMTGVMIRGSIPKTFGFLKETIPSLKNISIPFPADETVARLSLDDLQESTQKSGVKIMPVTIKNKADLNNYLLHIPQETDVIWVTHSALIMKNFPSITAAAFAKNIPLASANLQLNNGTLLSYGPNLDSIIKQVARLADKLLQGIPVEKLPIEHCEYMLTLDLDVANRTGITIPDNVLRQAAVIKTDPSPAP